MWSDYLQFQRESGTLQGWKAAKAQLAKLQAAPAAPAAAEEVPEADEAMAPAEVGIGEAS